MLDTVKIRRRGEASRGFTLLEAVVAAGILAVLLGAVIAIYFSCGHSWRRGITESRAQTAAWWVIRRMAPEVRAAMSLTPFPAPYADCGITLQLPARGFDSGAQTYFNQVAIGGDGRPYLASGNTVNYFRGDEAGAPALSGSRLWRVVNGPDGTEVQREVVVSGLLDNPADGSGQPKPMFIYWPDIFRLKSVETTVTVEARESGRRAVATIVGETALRNK